MFLFNYQVLSLLSILYLLIYTCLFIILFKLQFCLKTETIEFFACSLSFFIYYFIYTPFYVSLSSRYIYVNMLYSFTPPTSGLLATLAVNVGHPFGLSPPPIAPPQHDAPGGTHHRPWGGPWREFPLEAPGASFGFLSLSLVHLCPSNLQLLSSPFLFLFFAS